MKKEQLFRYIRYASMGLRHATPGKLVNALQIERRLAANNPDLAGMVPPILFADISNGCNLKCPLCQMGRGETIARQNRMSFENYQRVVDPVADRLLLVFLYNWGEPFLNRDIYKIIRYNTDRNIGTVASSNCNLKIDADEIVQSGLDYLIVSADGITQDVYEKYRVGGKLENVTENLKAIAAAKKRYKSNRPVIEWQCLVNRYNEHQLKEVESTARRLGANHVRFASLNFFSAQDAKDNEAEWLPENPEFRRFTKSRTSRPDAVRKPCFWLWRIALMNADGGLTPCCLYDVPSWGNALDDGLAKAWNSELFKEARERSIKGHTKFSDLVCDRCTAPFIWR